MISGLHAFYNTVKLSASKKVFSLLEHAAVSSWMGLRARSSVLHWE